MSYKDILVYLDPTPDGGNRLDLAVALARSQGARLIGVDASTQAALDGRWRDRITALPDVFDERTRTAGVAAQFRAGDGPSSVLSYGHYADLIVAPQPEAEARDLVVSAIPEDVLLASGVPMLVLPHAWQPHPVGQRVVVAWNASREATRAVHDAMPILEKAEKATVFAFAPGTVVARPEPDLILDHLRAHGVNADLQTWPDTGDVSVVEALFACLQTQEADLIVAGAYGRSRLSEGLFGGASRDLIRQPSMPVLMSH